MQEHYGAHQYLVMSGTYICRNCNSTYTDIAYWRKKEGGGWGGKDNRCPNPICDNISDTLYHVDELIAPTITLLNRKGYFTGYCCSGHTTGEKREHIYISFNPLSKELENALMQTAPPGFTARFMPHYISDENKYPIDTGVDKVVLDYQMNNTVHQLDPMARLAMLCAIHTNLYHWAESLPTQAILGLTA